MFYLCNEFKIKTMLIELKFRNFLSFKDETSFLMTSVKSFKEHIETNIIKTDREFDLLKSAAVYGANAGGKSNFIRFMYMFKFIVSNSYSNSLLEEEKRMGLDFNFRLNSNSLIGNAMYEASFLIGSDIYRYGFEINGFEIKKEWLYYRVEKEVLLFNREMQNFEVNSELFAEGDKYKTEINSNVLFLSHLAQNNQKVSRKIFSWFSNIDVITGLHEKQYEQITGRLLEKDSNFKKWLASSLKYLEISNIEAEEHEGKIITYHNNYDENNLLIGVVPFQIFSESDGTQKLIHILGQIYNTLKRGKILFIDEFDSKLHPNLSKKLIEFFHKFNKKNAQIIISGHDSNLLDKAIYRRDQIWFVDKNQFGASELYSLSEFDAKTVRNTSAFDKKYLQNIFGAADTLDITDTLIDLLYES